MLENLKMDIKTEEEFEKDEGIKVVVRPEDIAVSKNELVDSIKGVIVDTTYSGDSTSLIVDIPGDFDVKVFTTDEAKFRENENVYIKFNSNSIVPLRK